MPLAVPPLFKRVFWVSKRKEGSTDKKFFFSPLSMTPRDNEERFCESTLEKEGNP